MTATAPLVAHYGSRGPDELCRLIDGLEPAAADRAVELLIERSPDGWPDLAAAQQASRDAAAELAVCRADRNLPTAAERERGRRGVAEVRAALAQARRADVVDLTAEETL